MKAALIASLAALALVACAERDQTVTGISTDTASYEGTNRPFVDAGWKPGDRASWEQQMKVRTVRGQNEYVKVP